MSPSKNEDLLRVIRAGEETLKGRGAKLAAVLRLFARVREEMGAYAQGPTAEGAERLHELSRGLQSAADQLDAASGLEAYVADTVGTAEQLLDVLESSPR